jgi:chloramphenicol O-acetyltransferase type A
VQRIDLTTWPRREHYRFYRGLELPYLGITAPVDVRALVEARARQGLSLFAGMLHRVVLAANAVPELRQRIRPGPDDDEVVEHALVHPGFTVAGAGGLFTFAAVTFDEDLQRFARAVADASVEKRAASGLEPFEHHRDDLVFCSCVPWVAFTHVTHPVSTSRPDSVPRLAWSRIEAGRCSVNLQAHHGLVDGAHVGRFFERLAEVLSAFDDA